MEELVGKEESIGDAPRAEHCTHRDRLRSLRAARQSRTRARARRGVHHPGGRLADLSLELGGGGLERVLHSGLERVLHDWRRFLERALEHSLELGAHLGGDLGVHLGVRKELGTLDLGNLLI